MIYISETIIENAYIELPYEGLVFPIAHIWFKSSILCIRIPFCWRSADVMLLCHSLTHDALVLTVAANQKTNLMCLNMHFGATYPHSKV